MYFEKRQKPQQVAGLPLKTVYQVGTGIFTLNITQIRQYPISIAIIRSYVIGVLFLYSCKLWEAPKLFYTTLLHYYGVLLKNLQSKTTKNYQNKK